MTGASWTAWPSKAAELKRYYKKSLRAYAAWTAACRALNCGGVSMSQNTRGSNGGAPAQGARPNDGDRDTPVSAEDPTITAMLDVRRRLALVEHERRQAVYAARRA